MLAGRAFSARFERVPECETTIVKILGRVRVGTHPAARGGRTPIAERTANSFEIRFFFVFLQGFENFFRLGGFAVKRENPVQENKFLKIRRIFENMLYH